MDHALIGERQTYGGSQPFGLAPADRRQHLYVIGKTGTGKTTLLRNLLIQDIEAGRGCALIDPHGDLAEELLDHIPPSRTDDLVYFDPSDLEHPFGFNLLERVVPDERHLVAQGVVAACAHIWQDSWGPRLAYILTNAVSALLDYPGSRGAQTLLGVPRLLIDERYRAQIVRHIENPKVRQFWLEEFPGYTDRLAAEAIAPIQNKVGAFLTSPALRNILGQPKSTLSPSAIMNEGRILIANLAKGRLGEADANLLGALLVASFELAAMRRAAIPEEERHDFHLTIDEFHNFTTEAFTSVLSEARKYRLALTIAHQYVDQMPERVRAAVFGNVGTLIAFRIGFTDADLLAGEFDPYVATTLRELSRGEVCVRMVSGGEVLQPFLATTLPPLLNFHGKKENMRQQSRMRYGRKRNEVERKITRWLGGASEPA